MQSYQTIRGHSADFIVKYRLYATADGGRKVTFQHLRCDFMYEGDDPQTDGVWMIHPEFLDESGDPIQDSNPVALDGKASMWILFPQHRKATHSLRAKIGVRGHFMEGARKVGDVEIIEMSLSEILCVRHNMSKRKSMYAKQEEISRTSGKQSGVAAHS